MAACPNEMELENMAYLCKCGYGFNDDPTKPCKMCGKPLTQTAQIGTDEDSEALLEQDPDDVITSSGGFATTVEDALPSRVELGRDTRCGSMPGRGDVVEGRITHLERNDEAPPRTVYWAMSQLLLWPLILVPYVTLFTISGTLALVFAILGFGMLSQLFNPFVWTTTLMEFFEILVLRRLRGTTNIPVYRGLISAEDGGEYHFLLRGPLSLGNLIQGRSVRLYGRSRGTTLIATGGNEMAFPGTEIRSRYRDPWRIVLPILVAVYGLLACYSMAHWNDVVSSPVVQAVLQITRRP